MPNQKSVFKLILIYFAIVMMLLPPFAALNSFMTFSLENSGWYVPIQKYIVPFQSKLVAVTLKPLGITSYTTTDNEMASFFMVKKSAAIPVDLSWNCLGWQSALLLVVSLFMGLSNKYSNQSRVLCVTFGLFGTLLMNVFRMTIIAAGIYYVNALTGKIVHDYMAAFFTLIWLILFWNFSFKYLLNDKLIQA